MLFIQMEKEREENSMGCLWLCLCGTINKYTCMSEWIILEPFMQNTYKDGKMLSHSLPSSMHLNCPSKTNKNKLNDAFFLSSNLLVNPMACQYFPTQRWVVLPRNEKRRSLQVEFTTPFLSGGLLFWTMNWGWKCCTLVDVIKMEVASLFLSDSRHWN